MNSENPSEMRSLKNIFDNMHGYSYYFDHEKQTVNSSKEYIQHYFKLGGKDEIVQFLNKIQLEDMRYDHMKSVYMFGVWLYDSCDILRKHIDAEFKSSNQGPRREFLYRWYLTCLFHDIGYCYDRDLNPPEDFNILLDKIKQGLLGYDLLFSRNSYIPQEYQDLFLAYYQYRLGRKNNDDIRAINHGISSAVKLYDILKQLHGEKAHPDSNGLRWGPEIFKSSVVPAVWYILAHNIWPAVKHTDRAKYYKDKGLSNLIQRFGRSFIKFNQHPMLFLLCFIDTIEPIKLLQKKYDCLHVDSCLESVKMSVDKNCIHISFDPSEIDACCHKFDDYYLAAIVKGLNFLVCGNFKIADGDKEIVCFFKEGKKKVTSQDSQHEHQNSNLSEESNV